jgi:hypothetical protein
MVFSVSPSITVREVDLTTTVPAITTPPAAIAGVFNWGPVNERVLISSEIELANIFGKPTDDNYETFFSAADFLSYSNALYVTRVVSDTANTASSTYFEAKYPGELGNSLAVSVVTAANDDIEDPIAFSAPAWTATKVVGTVSELQTNPADEVAGMAFGTTVLYVTTLAATLDIKSDDVIHISSDIYGAQEISVSNFDDNITNANTTPYIHKITLSGKYTLPETDPTDLTFSRRWGFSSAVGAAPSAGRMHIIVYDNDGNITGTAGQIIEKYENVSAEPTSKLADGTNNYYKDVLSTKSSYIVALDSTSIDTEDQLRQGDVLASGANGESESEIVLGKIAQGYDLYKEANEVDVSFAIQGRPSLNLANYLISNLAEYRKDCMVFVSPTKADVVDVASPQTQLTNILAYRADLQNSSYWFMDSGYKYRYDKYNDVFRWVPLNGDMAGLASLVQPWESPAGYRKGRVRNVIKLAFNPNKAQRDQLYGKDVNPVITQSGQGTILFGDKTGFGTATGSAFTRINVRRLFITVEKAIATISAQLLFEFNDEFTQNQFRQIVDPFLRDIQGRRGIIDFRVVSDATVNTPQIIDMNTFRANIFIKPSRSINYIELTFVATRTGVEFEEIVGQQF